LEAARPVAYAASDSHFRQMWQVLTRDERLVLTAIASLIYDDPLKAVTVERIETWLVETDYPMDTTAIHAALRGLDYQDVVSNLRNQGYKLVAGMMQTWLLEHARLSEIAGSSFAGLSQKISWRVLLIAGIIILGLIIVLILLPAPTLAPSDTIPTVTLAP
jgi:Na+-transporting NADH:ubiquinone oxidoreductase subunit NqrB